MSDYQPEWPPPDESTQDPLTDHGAQDPSAAGWPQDLPADYWDLDAFEGFMGSPGKGSGPAFLEQPAFLENPSTSAAVQPSPNVDRYSPLQPPAQFPPTGHGAQDPSAAGWPQDLSADYWTDDFERFMGSPGKGSGPAFLEQPAFLENPSTSAAVQPSPNVDRYSPLQPSASASASAPAPAPAEQRESRHTRKYEEWLATPKDERPIPSREVIAGFAERTLNTYVELQRTLEGHVRAFEAAEGIPLETLKRCVGGRRAVTGIGLQGGKDWEPARYTAPEHLNKGTLACIAMMYGGKNPEGAYGYWKDLEPSLRPAPNLKIALGWAGKARIGRKKLGKFARDHGWKITHYTYDANCVRSVTMKRQSTNTATAGGANSSYGNAPSLPQDGGRPSRPAWQSSGSALGRQRGRYNR